MVLCKICSIYIVVIASVECILSNNYVVTLHREVTKRV